MTSCRAITRLLHQRQGETLDSWIADCQASGIPELSQFAAGLLREREGVVAGITHSESLGMVDGFVNKVKLIKHIMFGKAGFPLLRQRVLHARLTHRLRSSSLPLWSKQAHECCASMEHPGRMFNRFAILCTETSGTFVA